MTAPFPSPLPSDLPEVVTGDGSVTFFSDAFQSHFHSTTGAAQEALHKFVLPSGLLEAPGPIRLLDICYGLGYNTATLLDSLWAVRPEVYVELFALELDSRISRQAIPFIEQWPRAMQPLTALANEGRVETDYFTAQLLVGDARQTIAQVPKGWAGGIFLDPFAPDQCPQLWTVEFLTLVAQCLHPTGMLVTYGCGAATRSTLLATGLCIGRTAPVGRRSPGTMANWQGGLPPLGSRELEHLQTKAAVPYRDPTLQAERDMLIQQRRREQDQSPLEPSSHWKKRWFPKPCAQNDVKLDKSV